MSPASSTRIVVEFAGLPASGKSTVAQKLVATLNQQERFPPAALVRSEPGWSRKILASLRHTVARPGDAVRYWSFVRSSRPGLLRSMRLLMNAQRIDINTRGAPLIVLTQGPVQLLWSILFSASSPPSPAQLSAYLDNAHRSAALRWIVLLRCSASVIEQRLRARRDGRSVLDSGNRHVSERAMEAFSQMRAFLLGQPRRDDLEVLEYDSEQPPEAVAADLIKQMAPRMGRR